MQIHTKLVFYIPIKINYINKILLGNFTGTPKQHEMTRRKDLQNPVFQALISAQKSTKTLILNSSTKRPELFLC